jgi:hypothetical protein
MPVADPGHRIVAAQNPLQRHIPATRSALANPFGSRLAEHTGGHTGRYCSAASRQSQRSRFAVSRRLGTCPLEAVLFLLARLPCPPQSHLLHCRYDPTFPIPRPPAFVEQVAPPPPHECLGPLCTWA